MHTDTVYRVIYDDSQEPPKTAYLSVNKYAIQDKGNRSCFFQNGVGIEQFEKKMLQKPVNSEPFFGIVSI